MGSNNENNGSLDSLLRNAGWFVLAFIGLMAFFFLLQPLFFKDLIEPVWNGFGLHNAWQGIVSFLEFVFRDYGIFLVFIVVVFFWWAISQKEPGKKNSKK